MKLRLPHCLCLRPSRAIIPQALAGTLQLLNRSRLQLPNTFCPRLLNTQKPKNLSDPLVEDRHTYIRAFPDIVQIPEAHGKRSSLSFRRTILPVVKQDLFNGHLPRLFWQLSGPNVGSQGETFFFFFRQILLPVI